MENKYRLDESMSILFGQCLVNVDCMFSEGQLHKFNTSQPTGYN